MIWSMTLGGQLEDEVVVVRRARRSRRWRWPLAALVLVSAVAVAVAAMAGALPSTTVPARLPRWRDDLSSAMNIAGLVLLLVGLVITVVTGSFGRRSLAWTREHDLSQRRLAQRCVRRGQPVPAEVQAAAVATAGAWVRQRWGVPSIFGSCVVLVGVAVGMTNPWWAALAALGSAAMLTLAIALLDAARRARRWLEVYTS